MVRHRGMLLAGLIVFVLVAQALVSQPAKVYACTCFGGPTLADWIKLADPIFTGKVLSVEHVGELTEEWHQKTGLYPYRKVEIEVRVVWKGIKGRRVILHTGVGEEIAASTSRWESIT